VWCRRCGNVLAGSTHQGSCKGKAVDSWQAGQMATACENRLRGEVSGQDRYKWEQSGGSGCLGRCFREGAWRGREKVVARGPQADIRAKLPNVSNVDAGAKVRREAREQTDCG
jgi:hypothetical protein